MELPSHKGPSSHDVNFSYNISPKFICLFILKVIILCVINASPRVFVVKLILISVLRQKSPQVQRKSGHRLTRVQFYPAIKNLNWLISDKVTVPCIRVLFLDVPCRT